MTRRKKKLVAGFRVDGGKRIDLAKVRKRRAAAKANRPEPTPREDTRVAEAWERQEARDAAAVRNRASRKAEARLRQEDGGKDGAIESAVEVRISGARVKAGTMRCRPGTFEWKYGRNKQDSLFHAGSHLATLWERAGIAVASSADFLRGTKGGYATGISGARLFAIDKLKGFVDDLGRKPSERLIDYCVVGMTSTEIARKEDVAEDDMPAILRADLRACAEHFHFTGKQR
ncbi:MAG: hypothetical protein AB7P16_29165 [Bradyrhizobium sp.]|uniref:hypothetical protein n=1 Tax=Bradyrhizobium sp. TaxID=376 RepID=UPI003D12CE3A